MRHSMAQEWAALIYFYPGTQRKLLTKALKVGWSVTDIRDGRDIPLGTHPALQASVGYICVITFCLSNLW